MKGLSLAENLKMKSDEQHANINDQIRDELTNELLHKAKEAANDGLYAATLYDEQIESREIAKPLKRLLKAYGFKVSIGRTEGLGKMALSQTYLTISWK